MHLVVLRRVQGQQLRTQGVAVWQVVAGYEMRRFAGRKCAECGVYAVETGARHEADIAFGLMSGASTQSSAARLEPRNSMSLSFQPAVCSRNCARWAAARGGAPGSLTVIGLYGGPATRTS